ncbi:MAG: LPS export ABC transporter periplasmic protein LptC [Flavobacteriaceae bacterium]
MINIVTVFTVTMFFSCNNSYNEVKKMGISENEPIGIAEHINLKYTDSGRVTANLLSAKMLDFSNRDFPYYEFTNGVTLYLFDDENKKSTVVSDYAITYDKTNLIDLQGNVKIITQTNDTLFAEQLYYDQKKEWLYTNKPVTFRTGFDLIHGNGFDSNSKFTNAEVLEVTGIITLDE